MSKRYELLKDLPNVDAGTIIEDLGYNYECFDKYGGKAFFAVKLIENHPDWFLPEQPEVENKDVFTKDDVVRLLTDCVSAVWGANSFDHAQYLYDKFLKRRNLFPEQSKQPIKPDVKADWNSTTGILTLEKDTKERIEVVTEDNEQWVKLPLAAFDEAIQKAVKDAEMELPFAIGRLVEELEKDKSEGSYYHSWQANIAVAFQDVYREELGDSPKMRMFIHEISNTAAKRFLDLLCYHPIPETSINSLNTNTKTSKHWT